MADKVSRGSTLAFEHDDDKCGDFPPRDPTELIRLSPRFLEDPQRRTRGGGGGGGSSSTASDQIMRRKGKLHNFTTARPRETRAARL